jgi:hypothetical protein
MLDERWTTFLRDPAAALTLDQYKEKMRALRG